MKTSKRITQSCLIALATACLVGRVEAQTQKVAGEVTVSHQHLLRDGQPWIPHGFFQIAFAVPPSAFHVILPNGQPINPAYATAYAEYSPSEYSDMRAAGADSVRIAISQNTADPENQTFFDPQWLKTVIGAIKAARAAGLSVIIAAQDEAQADDPKAVFPNDATLRFWRVFAPIFGQDRGVLFELYNEPGQPQDVKPSQQDWDVWAAAMNKPLALVRSLGAVNVIVADGLAFAQQLSGAPSLNDPLNQVAYAAHPYPHDAADQKIAAWDEKFGEFSNSAPVILTEWNPGYYCDENTPQATVDFLNYLQQHQVGLDVVAWDWHPYNFASAVQNFPNVEFSSLVTPTSARACSAANGFRPGMGNGPDTNYGPGKLVRDWYLTGVVPAKPE